MPFISKIAILLSIVFSIFSIFGAYGSYRKTVAGMVDILSKKQNYSSRTVFPAFIFIVMQCGAGFFEGIPLFFDLPPAINDDDPDMKVRTAWKTSRAYALAGTLVWLIVFPLMWAALVSFFIRVFSVFSPE